MRKTLLLVMCAALIFVACTPIGTLDNTTELNTSSGNLQNVVTQDELNTVSSDIQSIAPDEIDTPLLISIGNDLALVTD